MALLGRKTRTTTDAGNEVDATLVMPGVADIIEVREETWGEIVAGWVRTLLGFLLVALVLLLVLYSVLAATVLFVANVNGREVLVARNTFIAGDATKNSIVYASSTPDQDNFLNRLKVGFAGAPDPSIYKILSGQYDTISYRNNTILINNKVAIKNVTQDSTLGDVQLNKQYLAQCVTGACKRGATYTIIDSNEIYGQVKKG